MSCDEAFKLWWRLLTREGDPAYRPRLTSEAFEAGYKCGVEDYKEKMAKGQLWENGFGLCLQLRLSS